MIKRYTVLFICTGNSIRSQMAEAITNHYFSEQFIAYSAGSNPAGELHPMSIDTLIHFGIETATLRSKSWNEYLKPDSPHMDFVFTLCDDAAGEICPAWPGIPARAHWGVSDPSIIYQEANRRKAFHDAFLTIKHRIDLLAALPISKLDHLALHQHIQQIGEQIAP